MLIMLTMATTLLTISFIVMILASIMSKKSFYDREKNSPFECGFDPKCSARMPFSLHFFLIAIIFLIFDVEIALLLPIMIIMKMSNLYAWLMTSTFFIFILLVGLYHEWNQGALEWTK
uniref:NADH-ubiquinone oxidoreductase chain 3 n=2 Tax=Nepsalus TaxID=2029030 RepID=A0AAU6QFS3_9NEOP|nr:NADH dehydrogenase subunit 3 [Nepsalus jezoensis]URT60574.1 NADH dehydrogenase subunit 3 [Nepsalus decorillus]URT60600.1 NADH dehydrogenase subunit 3 [Nepsalus decorillus]URT60613.1 NADH dehydrogenase subunit 3 [Nepsalus decorillus]URT60626.1 NADH dehydrogenase subunit 3 [Nepsalus decorillus]